MYNAISIDPMSFYSYTKCYQNENFYAAQNTVPYISACIQAFVCFKTCSFIVLKIRIHKKDIQNIHILVMNAMNVFGNLIMEKCSFNLNKKTLIHPSPGLAGLFDTSL